MGLPVSVWAAPQEPGDAPSLRPIVHIIDARLLNKDGRVLMHTSESLGTVIGPHLILTVLPLADKSALNQLSTGDWLTVNYWDNARQQLAVKDFRLIKTVNGIATLADPERVINPGDSGGGVFFDGHLIGNTWSYNADVSGNPLGSFNVALVPQQVAAVQRTLE
jgi:hypothetical protein